MPKRVLDFDALWASDKLASCAEWAQSEYAWLYGLADASGSFEMTNLRVIWGRVAAIRKNLTIERLQEIFDEFIARGLLFTWEENGKRYGHWTGSDVPGRLPAPSWRMRLEKLAPPVPRDGLAAYSAGFGGSKEGIVARASTRIGSRSAGAQDAPACELKQELEEPQAQDGDLRLDSERNSDLQEQQVRPAPGTPASVPEMLLEIYERERGELPATGGMTLERRERCERWLAAGLTPGEFAAAVRCAAATPFLAGDGDRGWRANFDWLIANRHNARKVLEGEYAPRGRAGAGKSRAEKRGPADLYAGMAPRPGDCGVRVNSAALARIRARQERLPPQDTPGHCAPETPELLPRRTQDHRALGSPERAPKPAAREAQPRASPAALE